MLKLTDVLAGAQAELAALPPEAEPAAAALAFRAAVSDSRQAGAASLFFALRGERVDGHDFALDAVRRGATGVVGSLPAEEMAARLAPALEGREGAPLAYLRVPDAGQALQGLARYWRRRHHPRVVGITGSLGKTSTKEVVAQLLGQRWRVLKNEGNLNSEVGLPLTLLRLDCRHEVAVLEMGMYDVGDIALLADIAQPEIGVVTCIAPAHLERVGSIKRIVEGKSELLAALPRDGVAIVNADDPWWRELARRSRARVLTFGLSAEANVRAVGLKSHGMQGITFELCRGADRAAVRSGVWGRHGVYPVLAAAAVGLAMEQSFAEMAAGLAYTNYSRMAVRPLAQVPDGLVLDDCYNALPPSMEAALQFLSELGGARRVAVLGDMLEMGPASEEAHREVGRLASTVVDVLLTVGRRAREIGAEALRRGMRRDAVIAFDSNDEALEWLRLHLQRGDRVLVKGSRGMYMEQVVAGIAQP